MHVGLGLPIGDPDSLLDWSRRADAGPFSTLGLLDRLVWDYPEPLVTLAAIAGATSRIRVQTEVLLAPLRETALLAKQCATLDRLSGGRFTLGLGVGGREDDFAAAGTDIRRRGRRLDGQLALLRQLWAGERYGESAGPIGPAPTRDHGPELLFAAFAATALERVARWGDGFLGAAPLPYLGDLFRAVEKSWAAHGRSGRPKLVAQVNVALGSAATVDEARDTIGAYYASSEYVTHVVGNLLTTPVQLRDAVRRSSDMGADELMLYCWSSDTGQPDRLANLL